MSEAENRLEELYTSGEYLENTGSWHTEDSAWKAEQIRRLLIRHDLGSQHVAEIGCGAGGVIEALAATPELPAQSWTGFDISPQAIELARYQGAGQVEYHCRDLLDPANDQHFDLLLAIDVFEHVPDYMGFLERLRRSADYQLYHIPLDLHVSSVLRGAFISSRASIGHLHYFSEESALATLVDTGHEILDVVHTSSGIDLLRTHFTLRRAAANIPRWLLSRLSVRWAARVLGGYSLLVLTR